MLRLSHGGKEIKVKLIIAVNGLFTEPFTRFEVHELEDHIVYLKILEKQIDEKRVLECRRASELVSEEEDLDELINRASIDNVRKAFQHLSCLLNGITSAH